MIYFEKDEVLGNARCTIIDIILRPVNDANKLIGTFSNFWIGVFTEDWIASEMLKEIMLAYELLYNMMH